MRVNIPCFRASLEGAGWCVSSTQNCEELKIPRKFLYLYDMSRCHEGWRGDIDIGFCNWLLSRRGHYVRQTACVL